MGRTEMIFEAPVHPYTKILIDSIPEPCAGRKEQRLMLQGEPPGPEKIPPGCRFKTRCPFRKGICEREEPPLREVEAGHFVACYLEGEDKGLSSNLP